MDNSTFDDVPEALGAFLFEKGLPGLQALLRYSGWRFTYSTVLQTLRTIAVDADGDDPCATSGQRCSDIDRDPTPPKPLWFGLYPGAVSYMPGETGAGKSSLAYAIAIHAARNETLWGIDFGLNRPVRVWYLDPENAGLLAATKVARIGAGYPHDLIIDAADGLNLSKAEHQASFQSRIERDKFDLIILDPLVNIFAVDDENNNAEAARHMKWLKQTARTTGACILLIHHTGKPAPGAANQYGRGASARLGAADVGLTFRTKTDDAENDDTYNASAEGIERDDECRLQIVKNRLGKRGSIYLQMVGNDRFELSTREAWCASDSGKTAKRSKLEIAVDELRNLIEYGGWYPRAYIITYLKGREVGQTTADQAIKHLRDVSQQIVSTKQEGGNVMMYAWREWVCEEETNSKPAESNIYVPALMNDNNGQAGNKGRDMMSELPDKITYGVSQPIITGQTLSA